VEIQCTIIYYGYRNCWQKDRKRENDQKPNLASKMTASRGDFWSFHPARRINLEKTDQRAFNGKCRSLQIPF